MNDVGIEFSQQGVGHKQSLFYKLKQLELIFVIFGTH